MEVFKLIWSFTVVDFNQQEKNAVLGRLFHNAEC